MQQIAKVKGRTFSEQFYIHLLVFIFLEEPKTTRQLVDELAEHGFIRNIRTIQRVVHELIESGFPVCFKYIKGKGNKNFWQWSETTNTLDNMIKAKSLIALNRFNIDDKNEDW